MGVHRTCRQANEMKKTDTITLTLFDVLPVFLACWSWRIWDKGGYLAFILYLAIHCASKVGVW